MRCCSEESLRMWTLSVHVAGLDVNSHRGAAVTEGMNQKVVRCTCFSLSVGVCAHFSVRAQPLSSEMDYCVNFLWLAGSH